MQKKKIKFTPNSNTINTNIDFSKLGSFYEEYLDESKVTLAYEETLNTILNYLETINQLESMNLPKDIYIVVIQYFLKQINETLQKHIDK